MKRLQLKYFKTDYKDLMPSSIQELKIKPSNFKKNPLENNSKGLWKDKNQQNKSSDIQKPGSTCRLKPENQICGNYIVNDIHIANKSWKSSLWFASNISPLCSRLARCKYCCVVCNVNTNRNILQYMTETIVN